MFRNLTLIISGILLLGSPSVFAQCVPTISMIPGTHYKSISENKKNIGKGVRVGGYVRAAGDCKVIAGARVAIWQANSKGKYVDDLRAHQYSNGKGRYDFITERPGAEVPHIHFMVIAEGYKTLITQWIGSEKKQSRVEFNIVLEPSK